jgi:hypothetical protein
VTAPSPPREYFIRNTDPKRDVEIIYESTHHQAKDAVPQYAEYARQPATSSTGSSISSGKTHWPHAQEDPGRGNRTRHSVVQYAQDPPKAEVQNVEASRLYRDSSTIEVGSLSGRFNEEGADFVGNMLRAKERHDSRIGDEFTDKAFTRPRDSSTIENMSMNGRFRPDEGGVKFEGNFMRAKEKRALQTLERQKPPAQPPRSPSSRNEDPQAAGKTPYPRDGSITPTLTMPSPRSHVSTRFSAPSKAAPTTEPRSEYYYVERLAHPPDPPPVERRTEEPQSRYTYVERKVERAGPPSGLHSRGDSPGVYYVEEERLLRRRRSPQEQLVPEDNARGRSRDNDARQRASDISSKVRFAKKVEYSPTPPGSDASSTEFRGLRQIKKVASNVRPEKGEDLIAEYERRSPSRSRLAAERTSNL